MNNPTHEDLDNAIKQLWLKTKPSKEAQELRSKLSVSVDDSRFQQWLLDYLPDHVWNLIDVAIQNALDYQLQQNLQRIQTLENERDLAAAELCVWQTGDGDESLEGYSDIAKRYVNMFHELKQQNIKLLLDMQKVKKAAVEAVIPLEAMNIVGLNEFNFTNEMKQGIINGINEVRNALQETDK